MDAVLAVHQNNQDAVIVEHMLTYSPGISVHLPNPGDASTLTFNLLLGRLWDTMERFPKEVRERDFVLRHHTRWKTLFKLADVSLFFYHKHGKVFTCNEFFA